MISQARQVKCLVVGGISVGAKKKNVCLMTKGGKGGENIRHSLSLLFSHVTCNRIYVYKSIVNLIVVTMHHSPTCSSIHTHSL